jgi:hypothetical protein
MALAQELTVKDFRQDPSDISAVRYEVKDLNGNPCALLKVGLVMTDVTFEGSIVKQEFKDGEWWIYMVDKSWWLTVKTKRYLPLRYEFPEPLQKKSTYLLQIERPQVAYTGPTGKMRIESDVRNADVYIDGEKLSSVLPFEYEGPEGSHIAEIRAPGFNTERREFNIELRRKGTLRIELKAAGSFSLEGISYEMANVPGGRCVMGDKTSTLMAPIHETALRPYKIGKAEVNQALWKAVMGNNPSLAPGDNRPVDNVSWYDVQEFIAKLNQMSGSQFRLPTEAEWEMAAQKSSVLGLEAMLGGVAEWCQDWYGSYRESVPESGYEKVVRGGPFKVKSWPSNTWFRGFMRPEESNGLTGFRLAQDEL